MIKVTEYIRPGGKKQLHQIVIPQRALEEFFIENNIEVSFEKDNNGAIFLYAKLLDYVVPGEDPEELIKIVSEDIKAIDSLRAIKDLVEDHMNNVSVEDYLNRVQ